MKAQDYYDTADDLPPCEDDSDISTLVCVPKMQDNPPPKAVGRLTSGGTRCMNKQKRTLNDKQVNISEHFVTDLAEEEMKQRKLMERVRELAAKRR